MDKLKILHVINNLGSGGAEKLLDDMLPRLNKDPNLQVELLLLTDQNNVFDSNLKKEGVKISVIKLRKSRNPLNIFYIREFIIEGKYDIVHAHLFPCIYWVSLSSKLIIKDKPKFVYTEHSTHNRRRNKNYLRLLEKWIYSSYDKIISISEGTQNNLIKWLEAKQKDEEKFIVINNGINLDKFKRANPYKKEDINISFNSETKLLCMVGRFTDAKDQSTIIKSMVKLPEYVHLLLVGDGTLKKESEKLVNNMGLSDRVHFLGFRHDVERLVKTCDIIIQSSHWEGFGLSALEGMAAGRLVIATNVNGMREIIGDNSLMTEARNCDDLSNKINLFLNNKDLYNLKVAYLTNRSKIFDISIVTNNYFRLYCDLRDM